MRDLLMVLGDQLNRDASLFGDVDREQDVVWMAEVAGEATHVPSHQARTVLFLSAMRHFRDALRGEGLEVWYQQLDDAGASADLGGALERAVRELRPRRLRLTEPGEWRVLHEMQTTAQRLGIELEIVTDNTFLCSREDFVRHVRQRKQLRMEFFYRELRRRHHVLMDGDRPLGGQWNYDKENRGHFGPAGPPPRPPLPRFKPDATTEETIALVRAHFASHPGDLERFNWPVTRQEALDALDAFIRDRLPHFGAYQDAMWTDEPVLFHSLLSSSLNLKLLNPREVIERAEQAHRNDPEGYPLPAVEGFIRQILGWREYVRGIYWHHMPEYIEGNALGADRPLPDWYWTGETDMACLASTLKQTLASGYAHHIQRLMVTGLFALLWGVRPREVHAWYLAVYVDAVEWVELPNTLGMSQYADGGVMASKPYAATGKYIQRMSNYCQGCRFNPAQATGETACPFTTLYWEFLLRHEAMLGANPRMKLQVRNLDRLSPERRRAIRKRAAEVRRCLAS